MTPANVLYTAAEHTKTAFGMSKQRDFKQNEKCAQTTDDKQQRMAVIHAAATDALPHLHILCNASARGCCPKAVLVSDEDAQARRLGQPKPQHARRQHITAFQPIATCGVSDSTSQMANSGRHLFDGGKQQSWSMELRP